MTQEQKNDKIAAVCGYKIGYRDPEAWHPLPNYFEDLNAMHQAEKMLTDNQKGEYINQLSRICGDTMWFIHATVAQRAEAFGKTLNLW